MAGSTVTEMATKIGLAVKAYPVNVQTSTTLSTMLTSAARDSRKFVYGRLRDWFTANQQTVPDEDTDTMPDDLELIWYYLALATALAAFNISGPAQLNFSMYKDMLANLLGKHEGEDD